MQKAILYIIVAVFIGVVLFITFGGKKELKLNGISARGNLMTTPRDGSIDYQALDYAQGGSNWPVSSMYYAAERAGQPGIDYIPAGTYGSVDIIRAFGGVISLDISGLFAGTWLIEYNIQEMDQNGSSVDVKLQLALKTDQGVQDEKIIPLVSGLPTNFGANGYTRTKYRNIFSIPSFYSPSPSNPVSNIITWSSNPSGTSVCLADSIKIMKIS